MEFQFAIVNLFASVNFYHRSAMGKDVNEMTSFISYQ